MQRNFATLLILGGTLVNSCNAAPEPTRVPGGPATIDEAGRATTIDVAEQQLKIQFDNGRVAYILGERTRINGGAGDIVVIGHDTNGGFVAGYMRQDGLPPDCYVDNAIGVDQGDYIELRGILWPKASGFHPAVAVAVGQPYPGSTRFCYDPTGSIWETIAS